MKNTLKRLAAFGLVGLPLLLNSSAMAQKTATRADSLRGSITPERAWWDLKHYDLTVKIDPSTKSIKGSNKISYKVVSEATVLQIDKKHSSCSWGQMLMVHIATAQLTK